MSCPYFKAGYFGICCAPDAIHVPGIDEMERMCFRPWYDTCPSFALFEDSGNGEKKSARAGIPGELPGRKRDSDRNGRPIGFPGHDG